MKKKIHNIIKLVGNMNKKKIIDVLVEEGYKNNTKLQNCVKDCVKDLIKEEKIKLESGGVVYQSRYGKKSPSKLRNSQSAINIEIEILNKMGN